jgi:signal transduction histidine kinase
MAFFVASTVVIGVLFHLVVDNYLENQARSFVDALMLERTSYFEELGPEALKEDIDQRALLDTASRDIYVLFDENYQPIAGAPNRLPEVMLQSDFPRSAEAERGRIATDFPRRFDRVERSVAQGSGKDDDAVFLIGELDGGWRLMIVRRAPEIEATREFVGGSLIASAVLMSILGLLGAIFLTRVVERRLENLNALSHDIREGDLTRRIPTGISGDEFDNLADNLNAMLDRIAELLESSRQVTNDIAHDLRTPLTRMQTRLEALRASGAYGRNVDQSVDLIIEDVGAVLRIFDALLRIAGVESGSADRSFEEVSLSEVVTDVAELYEPMASEKDIAYARSIEPGLEVTGDKHLLFQAAANIVENAIKYTPKGGQVRVDLKRGDGGARLVVEDNGPGIPKDECEKVFDRFYRLECHRSSPGNGLGLSLVKAIVDLHRGTIQLDSNGGGLRFCVEI